MKLFKKVLAVVLVGAMAVSMLTACGSSEVSKVKDALKDAGVTIDSAKMASANKASGALIRLLAPPRASTTSTSGPMV